MISMDINQIENMTIPLVSERTIRQTGNMRKVKLNMMTHMVMDITKKHKQISGNMRNSENITVKKNHSNRSS